MDKYSIFYKRKRALDAAYKRIIKASKGIAKHISRKTIIALMQEQSAPRFYITPETARLYINKYCKRKGNSLKAAMVEDLIVNFNRLKAENPDAPKAWLYEVVVEQPAKSFYMSDHRIEEVIFNYSGRNGK
jgi:hypothetical protein